MRDPRRPCGHEPWVVAAVVWCFAGWAAGSGELDQLAICCCDGQPVSVVAGAVPRSSASCAYRHRPAASHAEDAVRPPRSGASRCRWIGAASRRCMQSPTCEPRGHPLAAADPGRQLGFNGLPASASTIADAATSMTWTASRRLAQAVRR
jgi:hypothetical protein